MVAVVACDLVIDIGNFRIKGALFRGDELSSGFVLPAFPFLKEKFVAHIKDTPVQNALISSVNNQVEMHVKNALTDAHISYRFLDYTKITLQLDVDNPGSLGHDRIANAYGALFRFPLNDCIVVDIGSAITCDLISKEGHYLGGMIYPGPDLCAQALTKHTDKLPLVTPIKPPSPLGKTIETCIQSGIYYGQLGAIERLIAEHTSMTASPSSVKVIATGGATHIEDTKTCAAKVTFVQDLKELVDFIDPNLALVGLHEILKELIKNRR